MQDQYRRQIDYLRISITDFCNFRCQYCMPEEGVTAKKRGELLSFEELYYIVHRFVMKGVRKVRLTGGSPWSAEESTISSSRWVVWRGFAIWR